MEWVRDLWRVSSLMSELRRQETTTWLTSAKKSWFNTLQTSEKSWQPYLLPRCIGGRGQGISNHNADFIQYLFFK